MSSDQSLVQRDSLRQIFEQQIKRLVECGYPEAIGRTEKDFRLWLSILSEPQPALIDEVGGAVSEHNIPFLVVVPHAMLPIEQQIALLVVEKKHGFASLDSAKLWNPQEIGRSKDPYLICDVNDGAGNVGKVTGAAAGEIRHACREGLVFEEGIALALHRPESLLHHAFAVIDIDYQHEPLFGSDGSRRREQCVPELWFSSGGPTQNYSWLGSKREDRGVPSCRRRLFLGQ